MTYAALQAELKAYKVAGFTNIRLNSKREVLEAELDRMHAEDCAGPVHHEELSSECSDEELDALSANINEFFASQEQEEEFVPQHEQEAIAAAADAAKEQNGRNTNPQCYAPAAQAIAHLAPNPYVDALVFALKAIAGLLWGLAVCTYWCGFWTGTACRWVVRKTSQGWEQFGPQLAPVAIATALAVAVVLPSKQ